MNKAFDISRRRLLLSLPALVMAPRAFVQTANPPIRARGINHVTYSCPRGPSTPRPRQADAP